jgi:protein-S-isoprenylcysteine O-methyltransferase Ste14
MDDLKFYLFLGVQGLAFLVLVIFAVAWPGPWKGQRLAGSLLLLVGISLVFTARLQLGKSFSWSPQARKLVTHGLYSRIRNPIDVFGTLATVGLCLILQRPYLWLVPLFAVVMQTARARKEAQVLEAKFGDEYRAYRAHTWF